MNNRWDLRGLLLPCTALLLASCSTSPPRTQAQQQPVRQTGSGDNAPSTALGHIDSSTPGANSTAATGTQSPAAAQALESACASLRADIREAQNSERYAPTTSVDEDIVAATEAKDDQRIADLQQQYDQLGCPSAELPPTHERLAVPPPAPGALPH